MRTKTIFDPATWGCSGTQKQWPPKIFTYKFHFRNLGSQTGYINPKVHIHWCQTDPGLTHDFHSFGPPSLTLSNTSGARNLKCLQLLEFGIACCCACCDFCCCCCSSSCSSCSIYRYFIRYLYTISVFLQLSATQKMLYQMRWEMVGLTPGSWKASSREKQKQQGSPNMSGT